MSFFTQRNQALLLRYLAASVIALCADVASFLLMFHLGLDATLAAALAYALGIVVHWLISSRKVFQAGVAGYGRARTWQKIYFLLSALLGLAITAAIVESASLFGGDPRLAKLLAVAVSFVITWLIRQKIIFTYKD